MPGVTQPVLTRGNIKVGVVDFYEAPVGTPFDANDGRWKNLGVLEPGSFKFDPKPDLYFFESGVPSTTKAAFIIGIKGEADLVFTEYTMNAVRAITGQREPSRYYESLNITMAAKPNGQNYDGYSVWVQGSDKSKLMVGDQIRVPTASLLDFGEGVGIESTIITKIEAVAGDANKLKLTVYPKLNADPVTSAGTQATFSLTIPATGEGAGTITAVAITNPGLGYAPESTYLLTVTDSGANPGSGAELVGITDDTGAFIDVAIREAGAGYTQASTTATVPAPEGSTGFKRLAGYKQLLGTTTTREMSYRAVFSDMKGDQAVIWIPKALATGGMAPNFQDGKKPATLPMKLTAYGVQIDDVLPDDVADDPSLAGQPIVAVKWVIRASGALVANANRTIAKLTL